MDILQGGPIYMPKVTRVEVIDHRGKSTTTGRLMVIHSEAMSVTGDLQDDGRTLKLFLTDREEARK